MISVGDRQATIFAERFRRNLDAGWGLAALVLAAIDHQDDAADDVTIVAEADDLFQAAVFFDVGVEDRVEHLVGRQAIDILLIGAQLGGWGPLDSRRWDRHTVP